MFDVQQRGVPEQLVLTERRNLRETELAGWLHSAMSRRRSPQQCVGSPRTRRRVSD
jgi:hypothetical protein